MVKGIIYQFCLLNYDSGADFLNRIQRFLTKYQKELRSYDDITIRNALFKVCKTDVVTLVDIVPPFYHAVISELKLTGSINTKEIYASVKKLTTEFENKYRENLDSTNDSNYTLVITFIQKLKTLNNPLWKWTVFQYELRILIWLDSNCKKLSSKKNRFRMN